MDKGNAIFTADGNFKPVTTIKQAYYHLLLMRGGMESAANTPNLSWDDVDRMINKVQVQAINVALDFIKKHMGEPENPSVKEVCDDCISRKEVLDYCQRLIDVERKQKSDVMNYGRERVNQTEAVQFYVEFLCKSVTPKE